MAKNETYEEFAEKFKPKKTTDDCYTPPKVYDAVADWVAQRYGLSRDDLKSSVCSYEQALFLYPKGYIMIWNCSHS